MSDARGGAPDPERVEDLFARGRELPRHLRASFLAAECGEDAPLRAAVESLLAADDDVTGELEPLDANRAVELLGARGVEPPATIGPFRVVRLLGQGGMGRVFLAERTVGGFEQRVAIKVVKRGMDSEAILARFRRERQILARLEHPGIARLVDGGLAADGRPYFAMEHVDGRPITEYASRHALDVEPRLELFLQVCEAVRHAHANLTVHRDLKPSNILVTPAERVKLLDFGIAKLLDEEGNERTEPFTQLGARVLTPEYASPEQVRGEPVGTASDVYALGVVLFELLAGASPYDGPLSTPADAVRWVCEEAPRAASAVARASGRSPRGEALARRLRGDLDAILARALAKEIDRRYPSVDALVEDLRRHLGGEPVHARPPGRLYRAGKFVRRHRAGVALGIALLATLVAGLAGTAWQGAVAARERDRASAQAAKAQAVQGFLVSLLESVDPNVTGGAPWTAEQLLDQGVERLEAARLPSPEVEADLLGVLGGVSRSLGELERADSLWRRSLALRRERFAADSEEVAEGLRGLAAVLYERDEHDEASARLEEALAIERARVAAAPDGDRLGLAKTLEQLGVERHETFRLDEAHALYEEALEIYGALPGDHRAERAELLVNLGGVHQAREELDEAERLEREALAIEREVLGERHPGLAVTMNNLAVTLRRKGDFEGAEALYREALAICREAYGDEHPEVSTKLSNLAVLLRTRGEFVEAADLFRQVLALDRKLLGGRHVYVAYSMDNLATTLAELGRQDEALDLFDRAHEILVGARGDESVEVAANRAAKGAALRLGGQPARALPLLDAALEDLRRELGEEHPRTVGALTERAGALADLGRRGEAERAYRSALDRLRSTGRTRFPEAVPVFLGLGGLLVRSGAPKEGVELLAEGARTARETLDVGHWLRAASEAALARGLVESGEQERGQALAREVEARWSDAVGPRSSALRRDLEAALGRRLAGD